MKAALIHATITTDREDFDPDRTFPDSSAFAQFLGNASRLGLSISRIEFPESCGCGDLCYCQQCMAEEEAQQFMEVAAL